MSYRTWWYLESFHIPCRTQRGKGAIGLSKRHSGKSDRSSGRRSAIPSNEVSKRGAKVNAIEGSSLRHQTERVDGGAELAGPREHR